MTAFRALLDERVQRDAVEAAERADQHEIQPDAHAARPCKEFRDGRGRQSVGIGVGEIEIQGEPAHADGAKRDEAELDTMAGQPFAQQRADADADRERGQQEGRD